MWTRPLSPFLAYVWATNLGRPWGWFTVQQGYHKTSMSGRIAHTRSSVITYIVWLETISKPVVADVVPGVITRVELIGPRLVRLMNIVMCPPYSMVRPVIFRWLRLLLTVCRDSGRKSIEGRKLSKICEAVCAMEPVQPSMRKDGLDSHAEFRSACLKDVNTALSPRPRSLRLTLCRGPILPDTRRR